MNNKFILGSVQFGIDYGINNSVGKLNDEQIFQLLEYAFNNGIDTLDTADAYGNSSEVIGRYLEKHKKAFKINSKFQVVKEGLSAQLKNSLTTLKTERFNVYFYHSFSDFIGYPGLLSELIELKKDGKIRKIGLSVYENSEFKTACDSEFIDVIQFPFNLLDNWGQRSEMIKIAKDQGKELQARSVFLQGLFFMKLNEIPEKLKPLKSYLSDIKKIAEKNQMTIAQMAINYVDQQKEIDHIIIGIDNLDQLKENLEILGTGLDNGIVDMINLIKIEDPFLLYPKNWI